MFTYDVDDVVGHLVNPVLHFSDDEEQDGPEGCLSLPGLTSRLKRRKEHVVANGSDMHGDPVTIEGTDLLARCVQHETDHLDGILFIDRLDAERKQAHEGDPRGRVGERDRRRRSRLQPAPRFRPRALAAAPACGWSSPAPRRPRVPVAATRCSASAHEVVAVVTRPDAPAGRGRRLVASPGRAAGAEAAASRCSRRAEPRDAGVPGPAARARAGLLPGRRLRRAGPAGRARHPAARLGQPALLAAAGLARRGPVQHALLHGDEVTGATTFLLEEGLDTGPVFGVADRADPARATPAATCSTGWPCRRRAAGRDARRHRGAATLVAVPQPADGVSLAPKLTVDDARVDWTAPAFAVDRLVRACTPAPGAWTTLPRRAAQARPGRPRRRAAERPLRARRAVRSDGAQVLVGTRRRARSRLGEVRPAGKRPMAAADWARGVRGPASGSA